MTGSFYVDASVIVGLILGDFDVEPTFSLIADPSALTYSDFRLGEVVAAVSARARAARLTPDETTSSLTAARAFLAQWQACTVTSADVLEAIELVADPALALKFPDAIHLAIAARLGRRLLTNDYQQHRAAAAASIDTRLLLTR